MLVVGLGMLAGPGRALAQRPLGIDVSHWQGTALNWPHIKDSGITFAMCKATEGTGYTDNTYVINQTGAKAAGVYVGSYHFARYDQDLGTNGAAAEANYFWSVAKTYLKGGGYYLVPMLDLENISSTSGPSQAGYTKTTFSQWANAYCTTLSNNAAASGITLKPSIYTSTSFASTWLDSTVAKWTPWLAAWNGQSPQTGGPSTTSPWSAWVFWQYSDATTVTNHTGSVDGDVFKGTLAGLMAYVIGANPPVITNQPVSQTVLAGANVTFTVGASGNTPFTYQWRFNGTSISSATASSYTKNNVQSTNAGSYSVVVANSSGTTNSANAVLTVHSPPVIAAQPTNTLTGLGLSVTLSVTVTGDAPLNYRWQRNGSPLTGATTNKLAIANMQATNAGTYAVVVTNLYGTATSSNAVLTMLDPFITNQPQSQTVAAGNPAAFTVGAVGTAPLAYVWSKNNVPLANGGNISGSGTPTLTLASVQMGDMGTYSVTVSNLNGWLVSSNATLVALIAPSITTQPASQMVLARATASLSVAAIGPGPLTYQWRKDATNLVDGGNLQGAGTANLSVSNMLAGDIGNYSVVVSNANGSVTSSNALVSLWPLASWGSDTYGQTDVPAGLSNVIALAAGNYHSLAVRGDGTVAAWGAGRTNSGVGPQYGQSIVPSSLSNVVAVAGGYYHSLALAADGTIAAWGAGLSDTGASPQYGQSIIPAGLSNVTATAAGGYHSLALQVNGTVVAWGAGASNTGSSPYYGQTMVPAGLDNVGAIAGGGYHSLAIKADGTVTAWGAGTSNTGSSPDFGQALVPAGLTNAVAVAGGGYHSLALKADGTVVAWGAGTTNTGLNPNYGQAMVPGGLSNVVAIAAGRYHSLALKADGTTVIWGVGTTSTGTSPNYGQALVPTGLSNVMALAGGGFHTLVLESDGRPTLTTQPVSQTVAAGANPSYAVMAVGNQPMSYQWHYNGTDIPGATAFALDLTNVQLDDAGTYTLTVSNATGTAASSNALLTVLSPPIISAQPNDQIVVAGAPVIISLAVAGSAPLSYQWQFNSTAIAGATQSNYSLASADPTNGGSYSVVVSNTYGTAVSSNAVLTVVTLPSIITQPSNQTASAGASVSFTVQAVSAAPLDYQWYFCQTNYMGGADGATLGLTNLQPAQAGDYSVVVHNAAGSVTSAVATLTVLVPAGILSAPAYGKDGVFGFNVVGAAGSSYVIAVSTNLTDWLPLETNTSPFTFANTNTLNAPWQFYRARPWP